MRIAIAGVMAVVLAACTSTPGATVIVEHDRQSDPVVVKAPVPVNEGGVASTDDAGADAGTSVDASVVDGAPTTCTGPDPVGQTASDDCEARGPCSLNTCTVGEAFMCMGPSGAGPSYGYPRGVAGCVESAADESALATGLGRVNCCERVCVRHSSDDADCHSIAISCPMGVAPSPPSGTTTCSKSTGRLNGYCCR